MVLTPPSQPVFWIPPTLCAKAFVDFSRRSIIGNKIVHLIHPQPTSWKTIALAVSEELDVPLIPFQEWVQHVRARSDELVTNGNGIVDARSLCEIPALKLVSSLEFSMGAAANNPNTDAIGVSSLDVANAVQLSDSLKNSATDIIDRDAVRLWIRYWKTVTETWKSQQTPRRALNLTAL